jgi:beta-phosphoglucomutase
MNAMNRAVLWDVDGTMIDSLELHWLSWQDILLKENYTLTYERYLETFGQRNDTILKSYFGPEISAADIDRITDAKEECYRSLIRTQGIQLLPGVRKWLQQLYRGL